MKTKLSRPAPRSTSKATETAQPSGILPVPSEATSKLPQPETDHARAIGAVLADVLPDVLLAMSTTAIEVPVHFSTSKDFTREDLVNLLAIAARRTLTKPMDCETLGSRIIGLHELNLWWHQDGDEAFLFGEYEFDMWDFKMPEVLMLERELRLDECSLLDRAGERLASADARTKGHYEMSLPYGLRTKTSPEVRFQDTECGRTFSMRASYKHPWITFVGDSIAWIEGVLKKVFALAHAYLEATKAQPDFKPSADERGFHRTVKSVGVQLSMEMADQG